MLLTYEALSHAISSPSESHLALTKLPSLLDRQLEMEARGRPNLCFLLEKRTTTKGEAYR